MKWRAIINARFLGRGKWNEQRVRKLLSNLTTDVQVTRYAGHARVLAKEASEADGLIVAGGDGTVHEVVQHLHLPSQRLMILPMGTGNSLAKDLGLFPFPSQDAQPKAIDVLAVRVHNAQGKISDLYATSTVAIGYPAEATHFANKHLKQAFGKQCYALASGTHLFTRKKRTYTIAYNGNSAQKKHLYGLLVSNTRHMGNFLCFLRAAPDNGQVEVVELKSGLLPQLLHNISVLTQRYWYDPSPSFPAFRVQVELPTPGLLMLDGEIYPDICRMKISVLPRAIQVMAFPVSTT